MGWAGTWTRAGNGVLLKVGATSLYNGEATSGGLYVSGGGSFFTYARE